MAEREGFEPPVPLGTPVFKTGVIDHSTISPKRIKRTFWSKATAKVGIFLRSHKFLDDNFAFLAKKERKMWENEEKSGKKKEERRGKEGGISRKSGKSKKQKKEKKRKKGVGLRLTGHDAGSDGHGDGLFPYIGFGEIHQSAIGVVGAP